MSILPKIKSTISAFLLGEEGKISKQGILIAATALITTTNLSTLGGASGGCGCGCCCGCGCGCGGGICSCSITFPTHSSSTEIEFQPPNMEKGTHYSHSSV